MQRMSTQPPTVHLEVLRAFWLAGSVQPVGALVQVAPGLAADLVNAQKARPVPAPGAPPAAPETTAKPATPARRKERST
jgi:hypothetical protein